MLELSDWGFKKKKTKKTMINMPRALINKVGSMQLKKKKEGSVSREREILRKKTKKKNTKKCSMDKKHCNRSENAFDGLKSRLNTAEVKNL